MIILISGLTSSGKSVVAKRLAEHLNYDYIHTSHLLKQIIENKKLTPKKTKCNTGWYEKSGFDEKRSRTSTYDQQLDFYLLELLSKNKNIVLDSWTLPYLYHDKECIKIWLKATKKQRILRASKRNQTTFSQAKISLEAKDNFNISHFKKLYGFSPGKDLSVFHYILDTTSLDVDEVFKKILEFINSFNF